MSKSRRTVTAPANASPASPSEVEEEETQEEAGTGEPEEDEETMPDTNAAERPEQAPEPAADGEKTPAMVEVPAEALHELMAELRELKAKVASVEDAQAANAAAAVNAAPPVAPPVENIIHNATETGKDMDVKTLNLPIMFGYEKIRVGPGEVKINVADPEGLRMFNSLTKSVERTNKREERREAEIRAQGAAPAPVPIHFAITDPETIARMTVQPEDKRSEGRVGM
jgi:hypothetical protein